MIAEDLHSFFGRQNLEESGKAHRAEDVSWRFAGGRFASFDDFVAGNAFGPWQRSVHAQRPAQKNDEEHTDQSADEQDQSRFPVVRTQIAPQTLAADLDHHEGRNSEDCTSNQSFADRCRSTRDVLFEQVAAKRRDAKQRHCDDRRWNRGSDGLARPHAEVGVGRTENECKKNPETNRFHGHLGKVLLGAVLH